MRITELMPSDVALAELGRRARALRIQREITQAQLSDEAGITRQTLSALEHGRPVSAAVLFSVLRALGAAGQLDQLLPEMLERPIEQLDRGARPRQRVRPPSAPSPSEQPWTWGDES